MLQKLESIRGRSNTLATASSQKLHSWIERLFALVLFRWLYVLLARVFDLVAQVLSRIVRVSNPSRYLCRAVRVLVLSLFVLSV